jgi:hypothetical protein
VVKACPGGLIRPGFSAYYPGHLRPLPWRHHKSKEGLQYKAKHSPQVHDPQEFPGEQRYFQMGRGADHRLA